MKRRAGRGALIVIALLFASSGALRLGDGLGIGLARAAEGALSEDHAAGDTGATAECQPPPEDLARALSEREERLAVQEAALADRSAALALADEAIRTRLVELEAAEAELRKTLALADGAAESDLARLTTVYEAMKPKDAAPLFDAMDGEFAAGFLGRMRPDAAAAIMAGMAPEKAYAVSAILAGRNSSAPKD
jgi:flagellar motility protein MotE (MotC chaperone)